MKFSEIVKYLEQNKSKKELKLKINGKTREIIAMAKFVSKHYPELHYIKVLFSDNSFLMLIVEDQELYFSPKITHHILEIKDVQIGEEKTLDYNGKQFKLYNAHDYQYVIELMRGKPEDIEGECTFSDYFPVDGSKEYLSLGHLSRNRERADFHSTMIGLDQIIFTD